MGKFLKTIFLGFLAITSLIILTITAYGGEAQVAPAYTDENGKTVTITENLDALYAIKITPGNVLYPVKLGWESLQEFITLDATKKALLKQEHLKNRINELKYEVYLNGNRNSAKVLQKILEKRMDIEEQLENSGMKCEQEYSSCADSNIGKIGKALESQNKKNIEVLNNLLNNPNIPTASKKGLANAVNKSGMALLKANMAQGNYKVSSSVMSMLPFRTAMIYEPSEKTWYSVIINRESVSISTNKLSQPDATLYPTKAQMKEFTSITRSINKNSINKNGLTWKDVGRITKLWYQIKKEVN